MRNQETATDANAAESGEEKLKLRGSGRSTMATTLVSLYTQSMFKLASGGIFFKIDARIHYLRE